MKIESSIHNASSLATSDGLAGLTSEDVLASRAAHGSNVLTPRERTPWWRKFAEKFTDPLIIILLVAAVLSIGISCYEYFGLGADATAFFEPVGIIVAIALATGLAFWFEWQADREFSLLNQQNDLEPVRVVRDGRETMVPRCDIVVGDLVLLSTGDEIPADGQLLEATQMQVDESTLTGEPVCRKSILEEEQDPDATFPTNVVLRGTKLLEGHGRMRVTAVGDSTENGRVFTEAQIDSTVRTPLNEQLDRLGLLISRSSYAIAALVVVGRVVMWIVSQAGDPQFTLLNFHFLAYFLQSVMLAVTLIVVAVPEGLPMAVTLSLAYSMRRMLKTNNLVRRMHACETMGAATVICTDKTGTLTQNQMQVVEIKRSTPDPSSLIWVYHNIAINSTASLDGNNVLGNPTEGALLLWLRDQGVNYATLRSAARITEEIPFTTERKYMATREQDTLYIKGAPEIVMEMCKRPTSERPTPDPSRNGGEEASGLGAVDLLLLSWQQRGLRTLALAHADGDCVPQLDALVAIADPVRTDVPAAVEECLQAGIAVKIVTGDTPATAAEIARQIGLSPTESSLLTGPEVAALTDEALCERAHNITIIARARPMDKQRLVQALQACGEVVAVTGDGTNDAPALKAAHVGLSMGDGTAVAKEASDITIIDNSFASIGRAVMWGRSLYRNIQRFILFQMTVNVCACLTVLAGAFMGTDAPLTVTQMLWVNLIMDTFAAMALASLPPTAAVMHERPRDRRKFIISTPMWQFILGVGGIFFVLMGVALWMAEHANVSDIGDFLMMLVQGNTKWARDGLTPYELSIFFTTFVMLQFWNLFNARAFLTGKSAFNLRGCKEFLFIAALIFFGQILIVEFGGSMFNVVPLEFDEWLGIILITSPVLLLGEGVRFFKSPLNHRRQKRS
jgi:Ca2+-transporting ATPase